MKGTVGGVGKGGVPPDVTGGVGPGTGSVNVDTVPQGRTLVPTGMGSNGNATGVTRDCENITILFVQNTTFPSRVISESRVSDGLINM